MDKKELLETLDKGEATSITFDSYELHIGKQVDWQELQQRLQEYGYSRFTSIAERGDYAIRGGILDLYLPAFEAPVRIEFHGDVVESIRTFNPTDGQTIEEHQTIILLPKGESRWRPRRSSWELGEQIPIENFVDLEIGNSVVHVEHGIGIYRGIEKIKVGHKKMAHWVIEYADGDKLFVPPDQVFLVQRYIGFEGRTPKLSKLGTKYWQRIKEKARAGAFSVAVDLINLQAKRVLSEGYAFSPDAEWQRVFEDSFPYQETKDQLTATSEVKRDMEVARSMDRLLCGDVGYGKTEVAMRAAFKAVMDHKQVALLVPTTILAEQHYQTFSERIKQFPICVEMLSRFKTETEQAQIIKGIREGIVDIVIGTHRLLSGDIQFKDLGLVIIDEEQRFGVRHKEKLKRLRLQVDVLTLTATPIPRTLYLALMGARDMSVINTPPQDRLPVETCVGDWDAKLIQRALERELNRRGQCYCIHNRIESIQNIGKKIQAMVPRAKVAIAHGQMSSRQLERIMLEFIHGKIDILVSTTIVESGIDIPNANTLIVDRADLFGLADLYQLRGRVGRFKRKAYAYFLIPKGMVLAADAAKRLSAIERYTALGSGFKIAMEDLQIRGAGNVLGTQQHGHILAVGFDLYCRLLRSAIEQLKKHSQLQRAA